MTDKIPLVDLGLQHRRVAERVSAGFAAVLERTSFVLSDEVRSFERLFASYCGVSSVVGVGNGTDALELALRAAGIGTGDDVIVPANTFVATAEAVIRAGANVVLADCDDSYLIDPSAVSRSVTANTRAVIPVHLYGQAAPVEKVKEVVGNEVLIVEDAAQAQGARRYGSRVGALGDIAATSFYPGKNLGAYGDAGAVMTSSDTLAERVRKLSNHGGTSKYEHSIIGFNSRLDALQAVVLTAKLELLDAWNEERRHAATLYSEMLAGVEDVLTPVVAPGNEHVWHLYVVRVPRRDHVVRHLNAAGIGAGVHYPKAVHQLPAFVETARGQGPFLNSERFSAEILSLPIYPGISPAQQERVVDELLRALSS